MAFQKDQCQCVAEMPILEALLWGVLGLGHLATSGQDACHYEGVSNSLRGHAEKPLCLAC